jgi:four helix bundle suffix protein
MLGVSRGSYEELLEDYKDMARLRKIEIWGQEWLRRERRFRIFIQNNQHLPPSPPLLPKFKPLPPTPPLPRDFNLAINVMIDLITRTNYLFDQQKRSLEQKFPQEGGYTENLYKKRVEFRNSISPKP